MAKTFEQFKKEFAAIQKAVQDGAGAIKDYEHTEGHTSGVVAAGAKEIAARVQALKDSGVVGTTLKDFESDAQVKKMLSEMNAQLARLEKDMKHLDVLKGEWKKLRARRMKLKDEVAAEIKTRKKQLSTKLGTGNKSVVDMEKLYKEMDTYAAKDPTLMKIDAKILAPAETINDYRRQMTNQIDDAMAMSKSALKLDNQAAMDRQAIEARNLQRNGSRISTLTKHILAECVKAAEAYEARNARSLMEIKVELRKPLAELDELWSKYDRVSKDGWLKNRISTSPDGPKITAALKAINDMRSKARAEVDKIANMRIQ